MGKAGLILACILLVAAGQPAALEWPPELAVQVEHLPAAAPVAARLLLPVPTGTVVPLAAVVLAPDALGPDPRAEAYAVQLAGAGIAVLELLSDLSDPAPLSRAAEALAADPRIDGARIGLLGFGAGGAMAALARGPFAARALLYPGCAELGAAAPEAPSLAGTRLLLLHGGADPVNPSQDCAAAAEALARTGAAVRRIEYAGASFAWDHPAFGKEGPLLLPAPAGGGAARVAARPWPELTALSAAQVAGFFAVSLRVATAR